MCGICELTPLANISKLKSSQISLSPDPMQSVRVAEVDSPKFFEFGMST